MDLAEAARIHGNYPFGAVLRYSGTENLGGENSVDTSRDTTAHAAIEVIRSASPTLTKEQLSRSRIYKITGPCAMCSGAIYSAGIRRGIFRCWKNDVFPLVVVDTRNPMLQMDSRTVFATGQEPVDVIGPLRAGTQLHSKAMRLHTEFWGKTV